jgi:hypothetical protein
MPIERHDSRGTTLRLRLCSHLGDHRLVTKVDAVIRANGDDGSPITEVGLRNISNHLHEVRLAGTTVGRRCKTDAPDGEIPERVAKVRPVVCDGTPRRDEMTAHPARSPQATS